MIQPRRLLPEPRRSRSPQSGPPLHPDPTAPHPPTPASVHLLLLGEEELAVHLVLPLTPVGILEGDPGGQNLPPHPDQSSFIPLCFSSQENFSTCVVLYTNLFRHHSWTLLQQLDRVRTYQCHMTFVVQNPVRQSSPKHDAITRSGPAPAPAPAGELRHTCQNHALQTRGSSVSLLLLVFRSWSIMQVCFSPLRSQKIPEMTFKGHFIS